MKDKTAIFCNIAILFNIFIFLYFITQTVYLYCFNDLQVKEYKRVSLNVSEMEYTLTKEEARKIISNMYKTPHIYCETDKIPEDRYAQTKCLIRIVEIHPDLSLIDYATSYAHELTHLKYLYGDETMTSFKTFVILYESGHAELQHMALKDAQKIINGVYKGTQYDCGYYIIQYLQDSGYFN